ncbi:CBO0543 family protein [Bacillus sp. AK031]
MLFLLSSILILNTAVVLKAKKLSKIEMYATSLFALVLQLLTDIFLEFKYELYWYFGKGVDAQTLFIVFGLYPQVNILFLNFFPLNRALSIKIIYISAWSAFALLFEWVLVITGSFHHEQWKLWYSAPIYPLLYIILLVNFCLTKRMLAQYREQ